MKRTYCVCKTTGQIQSLIIELGYVPLSPTGAELLFEVFSQRYERGSIVTINLPFDEWTNTCLTQNAATLYWKLH
jgi:DNA replication protein DnaC